MSLLEAAAERKFYFADAAATRASTERAEALAELTEARAVGEQALGAGVARAKTRVRRSARWGV